MFPAIVTVDAVIEDVSSWLVLIELENVAVFAVRLERVMEPAGFVMTAELNRSVWRGDASIEL
jgi:hypothetical protein